MENSSFKIDDEHDDLPIEMIMFQFANRYRARGCQRVHHATLYEHLGGQD